MTKFNLQLSVTYMKDPRQEGFIASSPQLPNIIAEGKTYQEATNNLFELIKITWEDMEKNRYDNYDIPHEGTTQKTFELSIHERNNRKT